MEDLTGKRFGNLVVVKRLEIIKNGVKPYLCQCDCGKTAIVKPYNLKSGRTKSCGCGRYKNLIGQRFGRLTVIEKTDKRYYGYVVWKCKCDCGNIVETPMHNISYNHQVISCGCALQECRDKFNRNIDTKYVIKYDDGTYYGGCSVGKTKDINKAKHYRFENLAYNVINKSTSFIKEPCTVIPIC